MEKDEAPLGLLAPAFLPMDLAPIRTACNHYFVFLLHFLTNVLFKMPHGLSVYLSLNTLNALH